MIIILGITISVPPLIYPGNVLPDQSQNCCLKLKDYTHLKLKNLVPRNAAAP
jgi:hypothetical protein